jgi:WD40 repeat protein
VFWNISTATKIRTVETKAEGQFLAFSPDCKTMLTYDIRTAQQLIRQWNIASGECISTLVEHEVNFNPIVACFSPDGKTLLCGEYYALKGFDLATGRCTFSHDIEKFHMSAIAFSSDGKTAASGTDYGTVKLWDLDTGKCIRTFQKNHNGHIKSICFSPDGKTVYSADVYNTIFNQDIATGKVIHKYEGVRGPIQFSPDGKMAVSTGGAARLWNVSTWRCIRTFSGGHSYGVKDTSFVGGEKMIAVIYDSYRFLHSGMVKIYELPKLRSCEPMLSRISTTVQTLEAKTVFDTIATRAKELLKNHDVAATLEQIEKLAKIPSFGTSAEYYDIRKDAAHYCVKTGLLGYHTRLLHDNFEYVIISPTGEKALLLDWHKPVFLLDIKTGERIGTFKLDSKERVGTYSVVFSADDKTVLFGNIDGTMILFDTVTSERIRTFGIKQDPISIKLDPITGHVVRISPDGKTTLSSHDNGLALWDIQTGDCIRVLDRQTSRKINACFSPDGKRILSSGRFRDTLMLWDVAKGKYIQSFNSKQIEPPYICFAPEGKTALFTNVDKMILWDVDGWRPICEFGKQSGRINSVCISPNGKIVASLSGGTIKFWDIGSQRCVYNLEGFGMGSNTISFNLDGTKLIAGGKNGIIVYDLDYALTFPGWHDWDDDALPYLQTFLTLHPDYTEEDFQNLIAELQNRDYGWLRPLGVRTKLDELQFGW